MRFRAKICALRAEAYADTQYGSGADVCLHKSEHALVAEVQSYRREIGAIDIGEVHACGEADKESTVVSCPTLVVGACAQT